MKLKEGEMICDECNGTGQFIEELTERSKKWTWCPKCNGSGKLDWIEMCMGKPAANYVIFGQKPVTVITLPELEK